MQATVNGADIGDAELESMIVSRHAPGTHEKLKSAKIAIAGAGGLGSNIAVSLARLGVGELLLVDHDVVEPGNLNRQHFGISHIGMKKTEALKNQLADINPFINIKTVNAFITEDNAIDIFSGYGIICEAFDCPKSKAVLVSTLLSSLPATKIVAASGIAGTGPANDIKTSVRIGGRLYLLNIANRLQVVKNLPAKPVGITIGVYIPYLGVNAAFSLD